MSRQPTARPASRPRGEGPYYVDYLRDGDQCELSRGYLLLRSPSGKDHGRPHRLGALSLTSDPAVRDGGIDVGHALNGKTLRAPDLSIGALGEDAGTWSKLAPPLAVEYAARGQEEADLQEKIGDMVRAGTRWVWVVRLTGPRRVEVYQKGRPVQIKRPGERLAAPGVLKNAPLVEALYDLDASFDQTLQNLLQRKGYAGLDAVQAASEARGREAGRREGEAKGRAEGEAKGRAEGEARGKAEALLTLLAARGLQVTPTQRARVLACVDRAQLDRWVLRALTVTRASELFRSSKRARLERGAIGLRTPGGRVPCCLSPKGEFRVLRGRTQPDRPALWSRAEPPGVPGTTPAGAQEMALPGASCSAL